MTDLTTRPHDPARGIMFTGLAMGLFPLSDATVKWLSGDYDVMQLLFVRSLFVFLPTLFFLYRAGSCGRVVKSVMKN